MGRFESPLAGSISTSFNNSVHDITSRMTVKTVSFGVSLPGFITQLFHVLLAYFVFRKMSDITYKMGLLWELNKFIHIQQLQPGQSFGKCWKNAVLYFLACFEHAAIVFYRNFRNRVICMDLGTDCMQKMREREELKITWVTIPIPEQLGFWCKLHHFLVGWGANSALIACWFPHSFPGAFSQSA